MDLKNREEILNEFINFLKLPSISATGEGIEETAFYLRDLMNRFGIKGEVKKTKGHPVLIGEVKVKNAKRTILFYNHYDVQPVDPVNEWKFSPFSAKIIGDRIYARGSSDNKGTLIARLFAVKELMERGELGINVKFLFEGEEEIGSPNLEEFVKENAGEIRADSVVMEGSTLDLKGRPQIVLGVKGLVYIQLDLETGERDLHSSNAPIVYNPAWLLIKILNTMIDEKGKILIKGFYEDVRELGREFEELIEKYDLDVEEFKKALGAKELKYTDRLKVVKALFTEPTCNIDGLYSGYIGEGSKTIVPRKAFAKLDFRLVPDQDPRKILELIVNHLRENGFRGDIKVLGLERPVRTSPNLPVVKAMVESARIVYNVEPIIIPNSAGTQPMGLFTHVAKIRDAVSAIGVGDPYSNAHAPNESIRIENLFKAIQHTMEFIRIYEKY